jgi:hypothetical protein
LGVKRRPAVNARSESIQGPGGAAVCELPHVRFRAILGAFGIDQALESALPRTACVYIMASDRNGAL